VVKTQFGNNSTPKKPEHPDVLAATNYHTTDANTAATTAQTNTVENGTKTQHPEQKPFSQKNV
jgi:hypothetical protein